MNKIIFRASLFGVSTIKAFHRKMGCSMKIMLQPSFSFSLVFSGHVRLSFVL